MQNFYFIKSYLKNLLSQRVLSEILIFTVVYFTQPSINENV